MCGFNHASLILESQHEARQNIKEIKEHRGSFGVRVEAEIAPFDFSSHYTKTKSWSLQLSICVQFTLVHKMRHKHTWTFSVQLRAATAGACCWSVDCSCLPRYSLWKRNSLFVCFYRLKKQETLNTLSNKAIHPVTRNKEIFWRHAYCMFSLFVWWQ